MLHKQKRKKKITTYGAVAPITQGLFGQLQLFSIIKKITLSSYKRKYNTKKLKGKVLNKIH